MVQSEGRQGERKAFEATGSAQIAGETCSKPGIGKGQVSTSVAAEQKECCGKARPRRATSGSSRRLIPQQLMCAFLEESSELLDHLDEQVATWRHCPDKAGLIGDLLRALHTMKGGASFVGLASLSALVHELETLLIDVQANLRLPSSSFFDALQASLNQIRRSVGILYPDPACGRQNGQDLRASCHRCGTKAAGVHERSGDSRPASAITAMPDQVAPSYLQPRLTGCVRRFSRELGKDVQLAMFSNLETVDRYMLDRLTGPLEHLLRNAVDHGVESASERIHTGKVPVARISLELSGQGNYLLLHLTDDGRGLDFPAIRRTALRLGLMEEQDLLGDQEVVQFILCPGFSTATRVTQISGRGLGLDVVATEIRSMGGSLSIHSVSGAGSRFTIQVPVVDRRFARRGKGTEFTVKLT